VEEIGLGREEQKKLEKKSRPKIQKESKTANLSVLKGLKQ